MTWSSRRSQSPYQAQAGFIHPHIVHLSALGRRTEERQAKVSRSNPELPARLRPLGAHLLTTFGNTVRPGTPLENLLPLRPRRCRRLFEPSFIDISCSTNKSGEDDICFLERPEETGVDPDGASKFPSSHDPEPRLLPSRSNVRWGIARRSYRCPKFEGCG